MTHDELVQKAVRLSGRPTRKTKYGHGALRWLSEKLVVDPSTISRWGRVSSNGKLSPVPEWAIEKLKELEHEKTHQEEDASV